MLDTSPLYVNKHNTICVGHQSTIRKQTQYNINIIRHNIQTTGGKDKLNIQHTHIESCLYHLFIHTLYICIVVGDPIIKRGSL